MTFSYQKQALTIYEQVDRLIKRGLVVKDRSEAAALLEKIGYYRFSGYCIPFQISRESFHQETRFEDVLNLYTFDNRLRTHVFSGIEFIEILLRAAIAYCVGHKRGAHAHYNTANFNGYFVKAEQFNYHDWLKKLENEISRSSETFVKHFKTKYPSDFPRLPIWTAVEVMSFNSLSQLFANLVPDLQETIARRFGVHRKPLKSWFHSLVYIRNICAHHSRLWDKEIVIKARHPKESLSGWGSTRTTPDNLFYLLCMIVWLQKVAGEGAAWTDELSDIISQAKIADSFMLKIGLIENWRYVLKTINPQVVSLGEISL